ncbi:MAG: IS110 family transposase [Acidimicrobiia bacterium]|nr:IS110 family transposase [Acidimicrobiia bacterium]
MVVVGVDSHKATHTFVAVDENGRELASRTLPATPGGHLEALRWAQTWPERRWALEDCRHLSRRLDSDLVRAGEAVVRVPPKLMAGARRSGRERGKSDPIDALAVARAAMREPNLPAARLDGPDRELRLLVDHREDLVCERTRAQNRLLWHLHELEPGWKLPAGSLSTLKTLDAVLARIADHEGVVGEIARDLVEDIRRATTRVNALERRISALVSPLTPALLALGGCGALTAAKIVGETAGVSRFRSRAAFARHNGSAPIPAWSGNSDRHRLNRGGNRQLNAALHRIAITQMQRPGPAREYIAKRRAAGDTKTEAIRALRRRISDEVYRRLLTDERARTPHHPSCLSQAA